jgi:hypothetical protein
MNFRTRNTIWNSCAGGGHRTTTVALLALAMLLHSVAQAGVFVVDKNPSPISSASQSAYQSLRNLAAKNGTQRITLLFKLPSNLPDINTPTGLTAHQNAVLAEVASFQSRYAASISGGVVHASLTPVLQTNITAAGIDQLYADNLVTWFSDPSYAKFQLAKNNMSLAMPQLNALSPVAASNDMVAIVDTGVDRTHPEFAGRLVGGACFSTSEAGLPSLCAATNGGPCATSNSAIAPFIATACGHGTHVAGNAVGNAGIATDNGMAPTAQIMPIQIASARATGDPFRPYEQQINFIDVTAGLDRAFADRTLNGKRLVAVNLSLGQPGPWASIGVCRGYSLDATTSIARLVNAGISVVAASGNKESSSSEFELSYPACLANVIAVSALNRDAMTTSYSVYGGILAGQGKVANILAPGGSEGGNPAPCALGDTLVPQICAAKRGGGRETRHGTSMSAPIVTGMIARFRDRFPAATGMQIESLLINSGTPIMVPNTGTIASLAPLNAYTVASVPQNQSTTTPSCGTLGINWQAPSLMQATSYTVRYAASAAGLATGTTVNTGGLSQNISGLSGTTFVQVRASDSRGPGAWTAAAQVNVTPCGPPQVQNLQAVGGPVQCGDITVLNCQQLQWTAAAGAQTYDLEAALSQGALTGQPTITGIASTTGVAQLNRTVRVRACNSVCGPWSNSVQTSGSPGE